MVVERGHWELKHIFLSSDQVEKLRACIYLTVDSMTLLSMFAKVQVERFQTYEVAVDSFLF